MYTGPLQSLVDELGRLPGIGPKSAQRIAFHLLKVAPEDAMRLAEAIVAVKERITLCPRCFNVAEGDLCAICSDPRRDGTVLCVVEDPRDIVAVEKTQEFRGRYHVLHGALNPIEGVGPDQLRVKELLARLDDEAITEIILCTNPNLEGEATAMYLARLLKPLGLIGDPHRQRAARSAATSSTPTSSLWAGPSRVGARSTPDRRPSRSVPQLGLVGARRSSGKYPGSSSVGGVEIDLGFGRLGEAAVAPAHLDVSLHRPPARGGPLDVGDRPVHLGLTRRRRPRCRGPRSR